MPKAMTVPRRPLPRRGSMDQLNHAVAFVVGARPGLNSYQIADQVHRLYWNATEADVQAALARLVEGGMIAHGGGVMDPTDDGVRIFGRAVVDDLEF